MSEYHLNQQQDYEDQCYADLEGTRPEYECIDLACGHFDGDQCTLGGAYDCPASVKCPACATVTRKICDCDPPCECEYVCEECRARFDLVNGHNDNDYCDHCGKYTFLPINASYDRGCDNCGHHED